jgi:hypothetical protein
MYDQRKVEQMFLRSLKLSDTDVLQAAPGSEDLDPVSENVAAAMGKPLYVLPKQDHMAHLMTHMPFLKSPLFGANPVIVRTYLYPMTTHLRDHLLNYYLVEAHEAVGKAQAAKLIEDKSGPQVQVVLQVQQFIEQQLGQFAQELAQIDQEAQKYKPQPPMPPDNTMQIAQINAQVQGQALQQRTQADQARLGLDQQKAQQDAQQKAQAAQQKAESDARKSQEAFQLEALRQQYESQRTQESNQMRYQMNTDDNQTAMRLAAAEIASGDKVAVSTGTGINPNP